MPGPDLVILVALVAVRVAALVRPRRVGRGPLVHRSAGLSAFMANIGAHLKRGLMGWLTGAMAGAGLQLPAKFDLKGILTMIGSLLGLTWGAIRGRVVAKGVPEQAMGAVEQSVPVAQKLQSEGIAGVTEDIKDQFGDLKENLFSKISEYLIPTVLIAGVTWIISLLNPASAFVKACKAIIDFVQFIIAQGAQIIAFVNSVLDAIIAIAGGGGGGVPAMIEKALAASVPVLIGALAAILGIGGIADKVKKFFHALSKPVMKAVDWVVGKIVTLGKKLWAKLKSKLGGRDKKPGLDAEPTGKKAKLDAALAESEALLVGDKSRTEITSTLPGIRQKHGLTHLELVTKPHGKEMNAYVEGKINPSGRTRIHSIDPDDGESIKLRHVEEKREQLLILIDASIKEAKTRVESQPSIPKLNDIRKTVGRVAPHELRTIPEFKEAFAVLKQQEAHLAVIGREYGFWPLHQIAAHKSKDVANGEIMQQFRGSTAIRARYYKGFVSAVRKTWKIGQMAGLKAAAQSPAYVSDPTVVHFVRQGRSLDSLYLCKHKDKTHVVDENDSTFAPEIDHRVPVSVQWNDGDRGSKGSDCDQRTRTDWYNEISNLQVMCAECNQEKGGVRYTVRVGPNFRGPLD